MALSNSILTIGALVSSAALVLAVGCTTTDPIEDGTGGSGNEGGSTTTDGGGGSTSDGGSGGAGTAATCESYCAANVAACTDGNKQWDTSMPTPEVTCQNWCTIWSEGTIGEMSGDTLECRAYHTGAAAGDPTTHCPHAGPLGGGVCGASQCEVFCDAMQLFCTGSDAQYTDETECLNDCTGLSDASTQFVADQNNTTDPLACRAYHLSAALDDPGTHCQHAAGLAVCP